MQGLAIVAIFAAAVYLNLGVSAFEVLLQAGYFDDKPLTFKTFCKVVLTWPRLIRSK